MIGVARRYECSLTDPQLDEAEMYVLDACSKGKGKTLDPKYSEIVEDNKVRGYLRCGLPFDSLKTMKGETLGITVEGIEYLKRKL